MKKLVLSGFILLNTLGACKEDKKTGKISGELQSVGVLAIQTQSGTPLNLANTIKGSSDVKIESLKIPVFDMTVSGGSTGGKVYQCTGTSEDCLVELVGTDLTDLLTKGTKAPESIEIGTFDSLIISYKPEGCSGAGDKAAPDLAATVRASATYKGITYYTNKAAGLSTTGPAEDISFGFGACNAKTVLNPAITLNEGETVNVKAFFDRQALFSIQEKLSTVNSYCITDSTLPVEMCNNAVNIAATVSNSAPKVERFLLNPENSDTGCGGYMSLFYNESDVPFGGFLRYYLYEGQNCDVGGVLGNSSGGGLAVVEANTDGTLTIKDAASDLTSANIFTAFKRETHTGTVQALQAVGQAREDVTYTAVKL